MVDSLVQVGSDVGLPVIVDLGSRGDYAAAVEAGILARAHAPSGPLSDDEIAAMVEHGTATISTLAVLESLTDLFVLESGFFHEARHPGPIPIQSHSAYDKKVQRASIPTIGRAGARSQQSPAS